MTKKENLTHHDLPAKGGQTPINKVPRPGREERGATPIPKVPVVPPKKK
jgi:hypothetical protein